MPLIEYLIYYILAIFILVRHCVAKKPMKSTKNALLYEILHGGGHYHLTF